MLILNLLIVPFLVSIAAPAISKTPTHCQQALFTVGQEKLWIAYQQAESTQARQLARNRIIETFYPLVSIITQGFIASDSRLNTEKDDMIIEGGFAMIRSLPQYTPQKGSFEAYFTAVIRNALIDYKRKFLNPRKRMGSLHDSEDPHTDRLLKKFSHQETADFLLRTLSIEEQDILRLVVFQKTPMDVVAKELGISLNAARQRYLYIRRKLEKKLREYAETNGFDLNELRP